MNCHTFQRHLSQEAREGPQIDIKTFMIRHVDYRRPDKQSNPRHVKQVKIPKSGLGKCHKESAVMTE